MFKMAERSDGRSGETFLAPCIRKKKLQRDMTNDYYWMGVQENVGMFKNPEALREDGLLKIYSDRKQAILLLWQAGKGFAKQNNAEKAMECLKRVIVLIREELTKTQSKDPEKKIDTTGTAVQNNCFPGTIPIIRTSSSSNYNQSENNDFENPDGAQSTVGRSRWKKTRHKMEKLKEMCRNVQVRRASTDLYQTMLGCYEKSDSDFALKSKEDTDTLKACQKSKETLIKRNMVLAELVETERDYVDSLEVVVKTIIPAFKGNDVSEKLKDAVTSIFGNVEEIYLFHKNVFLGRLEECLQDPDLLGSTFSDHEETLMKMYSTYCQNKPLSDDITKDSEEEIAEICQHCHLKRRLSLKDFLIKPVQRLMKYQLLLQNIIKCTTKAGKDTLQMEVALKVMEVVPKAANDKMNVSMITEYEGDLTDQELIFQDTLLVSIGRHKSKPRTMRAFLFEEVLLLTEPVEREGRLPQYRCIFEGQTSRMGITETVESDEHKFAIWFRKHNTSDIYVCGVESLESKQSWIKILKDLISVYGFLRSPGGSRSGSIRRRRHVERHDSAPDLKLRKENSTRQREREKERERALTWTPDEIVKHATLGHPRQNSMSERLKGSIKRYLIQHYIQDDDQDDVFDKSRNNSSIDSDSSDFDNRNLLDTDVTHANTDLKIRNFPNIYVTNGDTDSENRKVSNDIQTLNSSSTDSGYHEEVRNVSEENMKITTDVSSEFNECTNKEINVENKQNIVERLNDVKRVLSELKKDESDKLSLASDSFSHRNSRKRLETAPNVNQMNANENLNTTFLEKQVVKRTASLPPKLDVAEQIPVVSENLSEEELEYYQIILAHSHYLVALDETEQSPEAACGLFDQALSLFFDVDQLKDFPGEYPVREDLLKRCTSLYQSLKAKGSFAEESIHQDRRTEFFSYTGLFSLLNAYANWCKKPSAMPTLLDLLTEQFSTDNTQDLASSSLTVKLEGSDPGLVSVSNPRWSVVLYSLAVSSSTTEGAWSNALMIFQDLARIYEAIAQFRDAVDSLIDAHYIQLETGDLSSAAKILITGFHLALLSRDFPQGLRLEMLAKPVLSSLPEPTQSAESDMLRFLCQMSVAVRARHLLWFDEREQLLPEMCSMSQNGELLELKELFDLLHSWLKDDTSNV